MRAVPRLAVVFAVGLAATLAGGATGCGAARTAACRNGAGCAAGESCVVHACVSGNELVSASAQRVVVEPAGVAFVTREADDDASGARAPTIALGASVGGGGRILLSFHGGAWKADRVLKAYLVLERAEAARSGPGDVTLRAARIDEPWSASAGAHTSWSSPPRSSALPGAEAPVSALGTGAIRIDVTAYAIALAKPTVRVFGLRVEGEGGGYGVPIATGMGAARGPRLEVYTSP